MKEERQTSEWNECKESLPPDNTVVDTKIHDQLGCRNETTLVRSGNLWWFTDKSMYVYYSPTHWRAATPKPEV